MSLISRRFQDFSDHEQFYDCGTIILYHICITKFVNPSSAGAFACSAGELEIESESWRLLPKAGDLASMYLGVEVIVLHTSFKAQMGRFYLSLHGFVF